VKYKICHITSVHPANDSRIFHKECRSLAGEGFEVTLMAFGEAPKSLDGVHFHSLGNHQQGRLRRMTNGVRFAIKQAADLKADLYHLHDPELLRLAHVLKRTGAKVIYDSHEDLPRQILSKSYIPMPLRSLISYVIERAENNYVSKLDAVVCATDVIANRFKRFNHFAVAVKNYPILESFAPLNTERKPRTICYAGGITIARGIFTMLDAILHCPDVILELAGAFESDELELQVKNHPAWPQVIYHGHIDQSAVNEMYQRCSIGLVVLKPYQSYIEALPIKMFEYMAAGLPIICSNFPFWKEIVEGNECGISVDPLSPVELKERILYMLSNPGYLEKASKKGMVAVKEKYNWSGESIKLKNLYKSVLN